MNVLSQNYKRFFYPPGGILIWMIIFIEILSFGFALFAFSYYNSLGKALFSSSRSLLFTDLATLNTIILLVSGYFMAVAVKHFKSNNLIKTRLNMRLAMLGGGLFIAFKFFEYYSKMESGITLSTNMFYTFYYLLTGFHLIHVAVGLVILGVIDRNFSSKRTPTSLEDFESAAAFWHMCDLIWLFLFPVLYLF